MSKNTDRMYTKSYIQKIQGNGKQCKPWFRVLFQEPSNIDPDQTCLPQNLGNYDSLDPYNVVSKRCRWNCKHCRTRSQSHLGQHCVCSDLTVGNLMIITVITGPYQHDQSYDHYRNYRPVPYRVVTQSPFQNSLTFH